MPRPTEDEKKTKKTKETMQGKMHIKGVELDIEIDVETEPNQTGGYDTRIKLPISPLGGTVNP